jgi:hypothetical protein
MSQELAQDEAEADADDYEIANLETRRPVQHGNEEDGYGDESAEFIKGSNGHGTVGDQTVVFALDDDDSDDEGGSGKKKDGYRDVEDGDNDDGRKRD